MVLFSGNGVHLSLPVNACFIFLLFKVLQLTQKYPSELNCPNQYRLQKQTLHVVTTLGSPQLSGLFQPVNLSHSPLHETDKKPSPWGVSQLLLQDGGHSKGSSGFICFPSRDLELLRDPAAGRGQP